MSRVYAPEEGLYVVIYVTPTGRMAPCPKEHKHRTIEAAHECVRNLDGVAIVEWSRDKGFARAWTRGDLGPS